MRHETLVLSNRMLRAQKRKRMKARQDLLPIDVDSPIPLPGSEPNHPDYDYPILIGIFQNFQTGKKVEVPITYGLRAAIKVDEMKRWHAKAPTEWERARLERHLDPSYTTEIKRSRSDTRRRG